MHQQSDELDELLKSLFSNQLKDLAENINTKLNENSNKTKEQTDKISIRYSPMSRPNNHKIKIELG